MIIYKIQENGQSTDFMFSTKCPDGWRSIEGDRIPEDIEQYHISGINNFNQNSIAKNTLLISENYDKVTKSDIDMPLEDPNGLLLKIQNNIQKTNQIIDCDIFQLFDISNTIKEVN